MLLTGNFYSYFQTNLSFVFFNNTNKLTPHLYGGQVPFELIYHMLNISNQRTKRGSTMITLNVRKQGGAAVITPANVLKLLNIEVGDILALDIDGKNLIISSLSKSPRRYSLSELLQSVNPKEIKNLKKDTKWFRNTKSVGREIP